MEKDQQTTLLPSTSTEGVIISVVNEDVVAAATASAMTTAEGKEAAASLKEDKKVFASEEQIRTVFCNNVVSFQLLTILLLQNLKCSRRFPHELRFISFCFFAV